MIGLFTLVVRAVLLAGFTFGFVVLFEHGPQGFVAGVPVEAKNLEGFVASLANRNAPAPTPGPSATSTPNTSSGAPENLPSTPAGAGTGQPGAPN